tara:strand:+ start:32490 stop:32648 length:159 start_codon:yes stop_codon:yes gene_type:complete
LQLEAEFRDVALRMLRDGHGMNSIITALQEIKVEMVAASRYNDAIRDALYKP